MGGRGVADGNGDRGLQASGDVLENLSGYGFEVTHGVGAIATTMISSTVELMSDGFGTGGGVELDFLGLKLLN